VGDSGELLKFVLQQTPLVAFLSLAVYNLWKRNMELEKERKEDSVENAKAFNEALKAISQLGDLQKNYNTEERANWESLKKEIDRISNQISNLK
jgi:thymidylate synthase